ncbi:hypothetical protein EDD15DRAFT_2191898 [Pisolithus albus]|nr:hypothetical protein EDD15DRAFT_2191898 [Pisolithus albus]
MRSRVAPYVNRIAPPSVLQGKTIEEIVNRRSSGLKDQPREFDKFSADAAVWVCIIENGNNPQTDMVTLDAYEQSTEETLGIQGGDLRSLDTNATKSEHPPWTSHSATNNHSPHSSDDP